MLMYARVYVEVTNSCNRACSFCPGTTRPKRALSAEEFRKILEELRGVTEYVYYHVMGEPLTHPHLPEMIRLAGEMGFKSAITTNGTLLATRGQALIDAGVYKVNISVHSFEDGEDTGAMERYLEDILDFADKASLHGVLTVLRLWNLDGEGQPLGGNNQLTLSRLLARFPEDKETPRRVSPRGMRLRDKLHLEYGDRFEWPGEGEGAAEQVQVFCHGLGDHVAILSDGRVVPCCLDREGVMTLGNVFERPLREILDSPRARAITEGFKQKRAVEAMCRRCPYARRFKV